MTRGLGADTRLSVSPLHRLHWREAVCRGAPALAQQFAAAERRREELKRRDPLAHAKQVFQVRGVTGCVHRHHKAATVQALSSMVGGLGQSGTCADT